LTVGIAAALFAGALVLARGIGSKFMPPLNEGDLMFMPIANPSISLERRALTRPLTENSELFRAPSGLLRFHTATIAHRPDG
jgi:Cu/Ag efflux pump CusA